MDASTSFAILSAASIGITNLATTTRLIGPGTDKWLARADSKVNRMFPFKKK
jgi:hypothetical protein